MFLSHASANQDDCPIAELSPSNVDRVSGSHASFDRACAAPVESDASDAQLIRLADRALRLQAFIQKAHQMSCSGNYPPVLTLQLLDRAWDAQKLLWELRQR